MLIRTMNFLASSSPSFTAMGSFDHQAPYEDPIPVTSCLDIENTTASRILPISSSHHHLLSPQPVRRRRRASPSPDIPSDPVIGQVTRLGKFKCLHAGCDDLTFGRQADFKRHYENVHAPRKLEYFCPTEGCSRSKKPANGKSKGRSFNNRKDKMEEHVRTVHHKEGKKRKQIEAVEDDDEENSLSEKVKDKRTRVSASVVPTEDNA
ncbi:uncharacterized protein K460DRAFT_353344 [Cucurbitaria berberidis CBS 394.84]|uniref:C2H2-type domain-containing protein n=1 Tax=Cucurbitaria berberidis CBS 394.84 TaxID=1168544 RepID=A0A9P4GN64_9PLEO|nr:uncharacterized protein K460DRAFT_353344 [Cucurbitaria berberidis CBS 394.84]KAF1848356.1 hypothetical protein K460DRAFT_353344 [Cucurbitaria berberidis CBS 394.84]